MAPWSCRRSSGVVGHEQECDGDDDSNEKGNKMCRAVQTPSPPMDDARMADLTLFLLSTFPVPHRRGHMKRRTKTANAVGECHGRRTNKSCCRLSFVEDELVKRAHGFASDLLNGNAATVLDVYIRLEMEHSGSLEDWRKLKNDTHRAVDEARMLATKWSTIIADIISVIELSLTTPVQANLTQELRFSVETLKKSYNAATREFEKKIAELLACIRAFRERSLEETSVHNMGIQSMVNDMDASISHLIQPAPLRVIPLAAILGGTYISLPSSGCVQKWPAYSIVAHCWELWSF